MRTSAHVLVLGLATMQSEWPRRVVDWTTSGSLRADFAQCISPAELVNRVRSTSRHTALLIDEAAGDPTPEVLTVLRERECLFIIVGENGLPQWAEPGTLRLRPDFGLHELSRGLGARFASPEHDRAATNKIESHHDREPSAGALVAVCGRPGSGVSTTAIALAQGLANCDRSRRGVLLADLSWRADQALLHDAAAERPSIADLFDAATSRELQPEDLGSVTFSVPQRGYDVLLGPAGGLDRSGIEVPSVQRALSAMRAGYAVTVLDLDDDFADPANRRGQGRLGAIDLDAVTAADAIVIVGVPSLTGLGGLLHGMHELSGCGVPPSRVRPVLARIPGRRRLVGHARAIDSRRASEAFLSGAIRSHERPELDDIHGNASAMPQQFVDTLMAAIGDIATAARLGGLVPTESS
ncbi:hypothetical protein [Candidatus Poriferisodalis sp.]|uniref:hypothetical protein n=1 Tax=Candidatus Poriferisodalis sp. TaxID=3101277 RepID=UPI003B017309